METTNQSTAPLPRPYAWVLSIPPIMLVAVAAGLAGSFRLGSKSLDLDEAVTASYMAMPAHSFVHVLTGGDPNMGLYYVLLRGWSAMFGHGPIALRSLSVVCAIGAAVLVYALARHLFGEAAGVAAGLLLAFNPVWVQWGAQNARGYALVVLLVAASSYFFVRELEEPSRWTAIGLVAASSLAVYAHYFALLLLIADLVALVWLRGRLVLSRRWLTIIGCIALLCSPEVVFAARRGPGGISWIAPTTIRGVTSTGIDLAGGSLIAAAFIMCACWWGFRRATHWRPVLISWLVVPPAVALAVSAWQPVWVPYYFLVLLPGLVVLAGAALVGLRKEAVLVAVVAFELSVATVIWYPQPYVAEDWKGVASYVMRQERPADRLAFFPAFASVPFSYYSAEGARDGRSGGRLWFVVRLSDARLHPGQLQAFTRHLTRGYRLLSRRSFANVLVRLYAPTG